MTALLELLAASTALLLVIAAFAYAGRARD